MTASQEQIDECFRVFDAKKQGFLEKEQLGTVLRALGRNPTEKELKELYAEVGNDKIDLARVKTIYKTKRLRTPQEMDKELRNAFQALDRDNSGTIQETELRQILGNLGDALTTQEVNMLMQAVKVDANGALEYTAFVNTLINSYPVGDKL